jgi:H+/Cl- antiporter ClcA
LGDIYVEDPTKFVVDFGLSTSTYNYNRNKQIYFDPEKYIGLGIPMIESAFKIGLDSHDFLLKILFTSFTIGAGFKGGEVTPLFFIGATLGNALVWFVPLPMALLAGMGFVALFSGASNTPVASTILGIEIFGIESIFFIGIACLFSYLCSGRTGIYSSQKKVGLKFLLYNLIR